MQYRHEILCALLAIPLTLAVANPAAAQPTATQPAAAATRPADTQPAISSDARSIREMIALISVSDAVSAADAVVRLKLLAKRGVPVWDQLEDTDPPSARMLLTWLRDHPGDIHHPSPLRLQWDAMDVFQQDLHTGKITLAGNAELVEYGQLAREMIRDGDPYGYYAILDVARTATDLISRGADQVTAAYVWPFLDGHLGQRLMINHIKSWKGYWAKPITQKREYRSPLQPADMDGTPRPPGAPWEIPTSLMLESLDTYQAYLEKLGLWQTPPWQTKYTDRTPTAEILKDMPAAPFAPRMHMWRLLRERMGDLQERKQVALAIQQNHPSSRLLQLALDQTPVLPYAKEIRKAWPRELAEQCPGLLEDAVSSNPRRQFEALTVLQQTLLFWPDREWANRTAVDLFEASGRGATEFSTACLISVDNKYGADKLVEVYRKGEIPDSSYNALHRWMTSAVASFRTACADKDLAPLMIKITTATQPTIDTSKKDWSQILRMAYELAWWKLNHAKLRWNEKTHRLEVPEDQLVRPTEEQILAAYTDRGKILREMIDAAKTRKVDIGKKPNN